MIKNGTRLKDTKKFITKSPCMSFPLVGNLSDKEGFWTSQNDRKRTSECFFTDELLIKKTGIRDLQSPLRNQKGIALVMTLVISAIILAIMAGLIYMITVGTQISGIQKRYKTAQEAGMGGAEVAYEYIGARGDPGISVINFQPSLGISAACRTLKLNQSTSNWAIGTTCPAKSNSLAINRDDNTTYDWTLDLGASPYPTYRVYAKVVDTVEGNSGGDEGLVKGGVVSTGVGEVTVVSRPYLYTIEVDAQDAANPAERAKYSILYQY